MVTAVATILLMRCPLKASDAADYQDRRR